MFNSFTPRVAIMVETFDGLKVSNKLEIEELSRTSFKIQGLFKTVRTLEILIF